MKIYVLRTEVEYEVPNVLGYYSNKEALNARIQELEQQALAEGDSYPLDLSTVIVEEVTLDEAITPAWM